MSHFDVSVQYNKDSHAITFSGDNVLPSQTGTRAAIEVPNPDQQKKIMLNLSGDGATFHSAEEAVQWRDRPDWIHGVDLKTNTQVQINDYYQDGDEPMEAKFTVTVRDKNGDRHTSDDPTIVHDPSNK